MINCSCFCDSHSKNRLKQLVLPSVYFYNLETVCASFTLIKGGRSTNLDSVLQIFFKQNYVLFKLKLNESFYFVTNIKQIFFENLYTEPAQKYNLESLMLIIPASKPIRSSLFQPKWFREFNCLKPWIYLLIQEPLWVTNPILQHSLFVIPMYFDRAAISLSQGHSSFSPFVRVRWGLSK